MPGGLHHCSDPISVRWLIVGSVKETLLEFPKFSFAHKLSPPIKQVFCCSGNNTDNQVFVELIPNPDDFWTCR